MPRTKAVRKVCKIRGCGDRSEAAGQCGAHYREKESARKRRWYRENKERKKAVQLVWSRTEKGLLSKMYTNIKYRVLNSRGRSKKYYFGIQLMSKEEFMAWAPLRDDFQRCFRQWKLHAYDKMWIPSPDRDPNGEGYIPGHFQFVPWYQNLANAHLTHKANNRAKVLKLIKLPTAATDRRTSVKNKATPTEKRAIYELAGVRTNNVKKAA